MKRTHWMVEVLGWHLVLVAFLAGAALLHRARSGAAQAAVEATAAPSADPLEAAAGEIREALCAQPDVGSARVMFFSPEGKRRLAVISLTWAAPEPPPKRRLETIARWAQRTLGGGCDVHVVTPERRVVLSE